MNNKEYLISSINPLEPTQGIARYNTDQVSRIIIANGIANLRDIPQGEAEEKAIAISKLGTPIVSQVEFLAGKYTSCKDGAVREFGAVALPNAVVNVSQVKELVQIPITGMSGSPVEYIGVESFTVDIEGVIDGNNGVYPKDDAINLFKILTADCPINVVSPELQQYDIFYLIVLNWSMSELPGGISRQPFIINCISYTPQDIKL